MLMAESIPLLNHSLSAPSAFTPEALVRAVRAERGIRLRKRSSGLENKFDRSNSSSNHSRRTTTSQPVGILAPRFPSLHMNDP
jgi:hypothetical protein